MRRRLLDFEVGDHVFLKVMPKRGVVRFGKCGKLSPRFIGPFEILERIGTVAYWLALPPSMLGVHEVFYVSMLRKYTPDPACQNFTFFEASSVGCRMTACERHVVRPEKFQFLE